MTALETDLLHDRAYIDGAWVDADSGGDVPRPRSRPRAPRSRMSHGWARPRPGGRSRRPSVRSPPGSTDGEGPGPDPAAPRRPDARARRRPGRAPRPRAGEAARGGEARDRVCRVLLRVVRRGGEASRRTGDPAAAARPADRGASRADRRHRGDHAVELPLGDADPQVRACARGRLHDGAQAGRADAALRARGGRARGGGRCPARCLLRRHGRRRGCPGDRRRDDLQPDRPQARLHRLDRGREAADGAVRRPDQEGLARARRQCAVHRLRRRRSRAGGRRRDHVQVPELRPDVHLGEPIPRPGRDLRRLRRPRSPRRSPR